MRELFARMPQDLKRGLRRRTFCKGEPVLLAGEENRCIYLVEQGLAMAWVADESGAAALVDRYGEGDLFGELEIFCEGLKTIEVMAASDCTVLQLDQDYLLAWMERDFALTTALIRHLARQMRRYAENATQLQLLSVKERVRVCLRSWREMGRCGALDKQALAVQAKAPMRSVNRALAALAEEGLVQCGRGTVTLLSPGIERGGITAKNRGPDGF